jgi:hypothetical protein
VSKKAQGKAICKETRIQGLTPVQYCATLYPRSAERLSLHER